MKKIILTGGGTAGHVVPNLALLPKLYALGFQVEYIGGKDGMEKKLAEEAGLKYYGISAGKLRRYMDIKNITDMFKVMKGLADSVSILRRAKPDVIFSKGGFVSVPVVVAGRLLGIPSVIHESDMTPGLANKIALPFAGAVCVTFPETLAHLPKGKGCLTGTPIRASLFKGCRNTDICGFQVRRPTVLMMGGSQGSVLINEALRGALPVLLSRYNIIHICGKGNLKEDLKTEGYRQFEYASEELPDLLASADLIVSRAGANSISEFLALQKPSLLIPLSKKASRGDQILNAESFSRQGFARVLEEEALSAERLTVEIDALYQNRATYIESMKKSSSTDSVSEVIKVILKEIRQ